METKLYSRAQRSTDVIFGLLFLGVSLLPQLLLASLAVRRGRAAALATLPELPPLQPLGIAIALSSGLALVFLQLLRWLPIRLVVYGALWGSVGLLGGWGLSLKLSGQEAAVLLAAPGNATALGNATLLGNASSKVAVAAAANATGVTSAGLAVAEAFAGSLASRAGDLLLLGAVLEVLVVAWFWKELRLAVAVLRTTTAFLGDVPWLTLVYPPLFGLVHLLGLALWAMAMVGALELLKESQGLGKTLRDHFAVESAVVLLFCYFWGNALATALSSLATASATASWYFAPRAAKPRGCCGQRAVGPRHCLDLVLDGARLHFGSLAMGAMVPAAVRMLRICLCWAGRDHERRMDDSGLRRCWLGLREGAAAYLERAVRFACRQAWVDMAIHGRGFCPSAEAAAARALAAPRRLAAVEGVGLVYRTVAQLLLIGVVGCCAALAAWEDKNMLRLVGWACGGAWLVAETMLHPVSVATTTILHCFLLDGRAADRDHTPLPLREFLKLREADEANFAAHYA